MSLNCNIFSMLLLFFQIFPVCWARNMLIYGIVQGFHFFNTLEAQIEAVLI